jgi:hypothetical protein
MKVTVDVKNAQATEETRGSDMVAEDNGHPLRRSPFHFIKE